jgi:DNA-directed RNA polymerase subunit RPC12/RpoP
MSKDPEARIREPWTVDMFCPTCGAQFRADALGEWKCPACGAMSWGKLKRRGRIRTALEWGIPAAVALGVSFLVWWAIVSAWGTP